MDIYSLGEVVGYDDLRSAVVGDAGKGIEFRVILLELKVDVREPMAADFSHHRGMRRTASALSPALAGGPHRRDCVFAERLREMTNRPRP